MDDQFGSPLSTKFLHASLSTRQIGRPIIYYKSVSSTNAVGFHAAELGTSHGTVILADHQTAGKGRLGRAWHSPERKNLYFSIVLTQAPSKALISWIPLLTGVALAETLESESTAPIVLKWPNDILCCEKKLGGILCEGRPKEKGNSVCVVGIG
ncbi:MAG: biotin--[acetyl-CoA-carboxylase] ligase, partial [Nitrospirales bacterium]